MNSRIREMPGKRFGRWVIVGVTYESKHLGVGGKYLCDCVCDCGGTKKVYWNSIYSGKSRSCGCLRSEVASARMSLIKTHGLSKTAEYRTFSSMRHRCSPACKGKHKKDYYDRGISVCEKWKSPEGFLDFLSHVGERPTKLHSLDRIDVNGNYEPGNVRWATKKEQSNNRRKFGRIEKFTDEEIIEEFSRRGLCLPT